MRHSRKINSPRKSPGTHQFVTFHQSPKLHSLSTHRSTLTAQQIAVRRPLILTNELRNISKLLVVGVFLEPVLDFLGVHFFHRLFNCVLIPVSRADLQKKHSFKEKDQPTGDLRTRFPPGSIVPSANPEASKPACSSLHLFPRRSWSIPPAAHSDLT